MLMKYEMCLTLPLPNDIEFSGERKRVRCNELLDAGRRAAPPSAEAAEEKPQNAVDRGPERRPGEEGRA